MNQTKCTRREALSYGAAAILAGAGLPGLRAVAAEPIQSAPPSGLLKKHIKGRTINVHAHLGASGGPLARAFEMRSGPRDPDAPITERERRAALAYFNRYSEDPLEWDSKEQETEYVRKYSMRRRNPPPPGTFMENAVRYLKEVDEAGIDTTVLHLLEFAGPVLRQGRIDPSTERAEKAMADAAEIDKKFPGRFIFFAGIDVRRGKDGTKLLEKAVKKYGFKGCGEIVTTLWQTPPNDKLCMPYYETCMDLGIPVMIDATMDRGFTEPPMYEEVARKFPNLKICLGGAGIRVNAYERDGKKMPAYNRMLEIAEYYDNIWLDLDDWQVADKKGTHRFLDYLRRALDGPARNKIMFGSDFPVFAWMYTEKEWIEHALKSMDAGPLEFSNEERELFFSSNAMRYLGRS